MEVSNYQLDIVYYLKMILIWDSSMKKTILMLKDKTANCSMKKMPMTLSQGFQQWKTQTTVCWTNFMLIKIVFT